MGAKLRREMYTWVEALIAYQPISGCCLKQRETTNAGQHHCAAATRPNNANTSYRIRTAAAPPRVSPHVYTQVSAKPGAMAMAGCQLCLRIRTCWGCSPRAAQSFPSTTCRARRMAATGRCELDAGAKSDENGNVMVNGT